MRLNIGPLTIELSGVTEQEIPVNSRLFLDHKPATKEADRYYTFYFVNRLPLPSNDWQITFQRDAIIVLRKEEQETRLLAVGNLNACYALYQERNERDANIYFIEGLKRELQTDTLFISCLCLERPLSVQGCYILHCTFLDYRGQAILFSGPSGIGKSTHANLWCRHIPGTQVLNGDRALLCPLPNGDYEITGWPVCGSSGICHNERRPLEAIVFIEQASDNTIRPQTAMKHFKALCSQVTINWWNPKLTGKALDDLQVLTRQTSISTYACNMNPEAAFTLHRYLTKLEIIR